MLWFHNSEMNWSLSSSKLVSMHEKWHTSVRAQDSLHRDRSSRELSDTEAVVLSSWCQLAFTQEACYSTSPVWCTHHELSGVIFHNIIWMMSQMQSLKQVQSASVHDKAGLVSSGMTGPTHRWLFCYLAKFLNLRHFRLCSLIGLETLYLIYFIIVKKNTLSNLLIKQSLLWLHLKWFTVQWKHTLVLCYPP